MAKEPFLINPPKRRKMRKGRRVGAQRPLSGILLGKEGSRHRPVVYSYKGHWFTSPAAKVASRGLKINPLRRRRKARRNPFGEEAMIVGLNPARRRFGMSIFGRKRRRVRKNRARRRKNPMYSLNRKRRRSYRRRRNPVSRRRYRRNPAFSMGALTSGMQSYAPMILGGVGGMMAVRAVPRLLGVSGIPFYGIQAAVIIGGGMAVKKLSAPAAEGFIIGAAATAAYDMAKGFLGTTFSYLGLGEEYLNAYPQMEAYPETSYLNEGMSGFGSYHDDI